MCQSQPHSSHPCSLVSIRLISTCLSWFFFLIIFQSTMQSEQESRNSKALTMCAHCNRVWAQGKVAASLRGGPWWTSSVLENRKVFWACVNLRDSYSLQAHQGHGHLCCLWVERTMNNGLEQSWKNVFCKELDSTFFFFALHTIQSWCDDTILL